MDAVKLAAKLSLFARLLRLSSTLQIDVTEQVKNGLREIAGPAPSVGEFRIADFNGGKLVPCMNTHEIDTARFTGKLDAIKLYKDRTKLSLMDSKHAVEDYMDKLGHTFKSYR